MLRLAFDFIITWRETRTRPNAYRETEVILGFSFFFLWGWSETGVWNEVECMT